MGTWIVLGVVIVAAIAALVFICKNGGWGGCGGGCTVTRPRRRCGDFSTERVRNSGSFCISG